MQDDFYEKKMGPSVSVAYKDGVLTQAAKGFIQSQGLTENDIKVEKTDKGEYIYVEKNLKGVATKEIISDILLKTIKSIEFDKNMKWGKRSFRFARPIKWILATLNDEVIDFEFEGVKSGNRTRGMRLYGSQDILISDSSKYESELLKEYVVVDPIKRRQMVIDSVKNNCENDGDRAIINDYLLDEVYNLVEYPFAIKGEFNKDYLKLPEDIITITMETHQRYFPVKDSNGNLVNKFILIRNAPEFSELVKKGNEKVIEPRLSDAKFFFDEDLKIKLDDMVEKLKQVTFQKEMGTIFNKIERSTKIAKYLIDDLDLPNEKDILRTVYLAKADLVSNVISEKEFTKLQGFMGSIYAKYEGEKENVSKGIFEHYLPRYQGDILPETIEGAIASISDKLDTVMGCFAVGLIPTSSKDPYALRRATQGIVLTAINSGLNFDYIKLINRAYEIFSEDKKVLNKDAVKNVVDFFKSRLEAQLQTRFSKNLISYQINKESKIIDLVSKIEYLEKLSKTEDFEILINLIKRLKNISKNINKEVNVDLFNKKEEKDLFEITSKLKGNIEDVNILLENKNVINNFFENVIINDEDESIRNNRLALIDKMVNKLDLILDVK